MTAVSELFCDGLLRLIEANAPFWGAEAEIIRSYWDAPVRTTATDRKWLIHQIYKEHRGVQSQLERFRELLPETANERGRRRLLATAEVLQEEVAHFNLFANIYRELEGLDYDLSPEALGEQGAWRENDDLAALRSRHKSDSPRLGRRAHSLTEGGYCALFTEGMALRGRGGFDDAVARVCAEIHADEINHMLLGIVDSDNATLSDNDWQDLMSFTVAQMKQRILMRNAQFSFPVADTRIAELLQGQGDPVEFDFSGAMTLFEQGHCG